MLETELTPGQCRAARALLDLTQPSLAGAAGVGLSTVVDFEKQRRTVSSASAAAIRAALEAAGVIFVQENGDGPGVRLRKTGAAGHAHALEHAEAAADRHLAGVEATDEEKGRRKRAVTQVSKKMRAKTGVTGG